MKRKPGVWVVEMLNHGRWEPTVSARLTRENARIEQWEWSRRNNYDKFRVARYVKEK